jgi:hypothetical protein
MLGDLADHPYFPLAAGSAWRYATGQRKRGPAWEARSAEGQELPSVCSTLAVLAVERELGRLTAELADRVEGSTGQESRYQLVLTPDGILPGVGTMKAGTIEVRSTDAIGLYLPSSVGVGYAWRYSVIYRSALQQTAISGSMWADREEDLETPAGAFHVLHVRGEVLTEMVAAAVRGGEARSAEGPRVSQVQHEDHFYAKGVGLVRSVLRTDAGYQTIKELTEYRR